MLGLGETTEEVLETLADLRSIGCDLLTLGQYLQPSPRHLPVARYLPRQSSTSWARIARSLGFAEVASGPFVRSSYHADEMARIESGPPRSMALALGSDFTPRVADCAAHVDRLTSRDWHAVRDHVMKSSREPWPGRMSSSRLDGQARRAT